MKPQELLGLVPSGPESKEINRVCCVLHPLAPRRGLLFARRGRCHVPQGQPACSGPVLLGPDVVAPDVQERLAQI